MEPAAPVVVVFVDNNNSIMEPAAPAVVVFVDKNNSIMEPAAHVVVFVDKNNSIMEPTAPVVVVFVDKTNSIMEPAAHVVVFVDKNNSIMEPTAPVVVVFVDKTNSIMEPAAHVVVFVDKNNSIMEPTAHAVLPRNCHYCSGDLKPTQVKAFDAAVKADGVSSFPSADRLTGPVVRRPCPDRLTWVRFPLSPWISFRVETHQGLATVAATLPAAWRHRLSAGAGWPGVSIL